jgi:hypothetical protein
MYIDTLKLHALHLFDSAHGHIVKTAQGESCISIFCALHHNRSGNPPQKLAALVNLTSPSEFKSHSESHDFLFQPLQVEVLEEHKCSEE